MSLVLSVPQSYRQPKSQHGLAFRLLELAHWHTCCDNLEFKQQQQQNHRPRLFLRLLGFKQQQKTPQAPFV